MDWRIAVGLAVAALVLWAARQLGKVCDAAERCRAMREEAEE